MSRFVNTLALIACLGMIAACTPAGDDGGSATDSGDSGTEPAAAPSAAETFASTVDPIIQAKCANCHGGDSTKGGLNMLSYDSFMAGGNSGSPVVAGDPNASLIVQVVSGTHPDGMKMPPQGEGLSDAQVDALKGWISSL